MIKSSPTIKDKISPEDMINMVNYISTSYFLDDQYTPYYRDVVDLTAFFMYCVDGVTFETYTDENGETQTEPMYSNLSSDEELMSMYNDFNENRETTYNVLSGQLKEVDVQVNDIVKYEKTCRALLLAADRISDSIKENLGKTKK